MKFNNGKLTMIVAMDQNNVIGYKGKLPWHIKGDLKWFYQNTKHKNVVMGRVNYEDIINYTNGNPLPNRNNIILSRTLSNNIKGFLVLNSLDALKDEYPDEDLTIIGGSYLYEEFLPYTDELIITRIHAQFAGDTFFPKFDSSLYEETFKQTNIEEHIQFDFHIYQRKTL